NRIDSRCSFRLTRGMAVLRSARHSGRSAFLAFVLTVMAQVEIGADQRRPPERGQDTALFLRLARNRLAHRRAHARRRGPRFRGTPGERADEVAIGVKRQDFEPGQSTLAEPAAIISSSALLRGGHSRAPIFPLIYPREPLE